MRELHIRIGETLLVNESIHACIGYFDGIHQGHQQLIATVVELAEQQGGTPALITFDPDPWAVIKGMDDIPHLTSMEERKKIAAQLGIELWIILEFSVEMATLSVEEFHQQILNPLQLKTLVCGYDFHYAHFGMGSVETLRKQDHFDVMVIDEISRNQEKVSSSRIERMIELGDMQEAEKLLTRPYQISGLVVHGLKNGRKIGFPTANLHMQERYVIPREGVYAGIVILHGNKYPAMINVGKNPTIGESQDNHIEAHLFDFHQDIYGEHVSFVFYQYLRKDVKFSGLNELADQLKQDKQAALMVLAKRQEG